LDTEAPRRAEARAGREALRRAAVVVAFFLLTEAFLVER